MNATTLSLDRFWAPNMTVSDLECLLYSETMSFIAPGEGKWLSISVPVILVLRVSLVANFCAGAVHAEVAID